MASKNVQVKTVAGDSLFPKTRASLVISGDGASTLAGVEPNAQVNKIEKIIVNGVEAVPSNKTVTIEVNQSNYSLVKATTETGYIASYQLTKDGEAVGDKINIPKDMVIESGDVKTVTLPDTPVVGYKVGDKYLDLVLANADESHIYILVSDLVDVFTGGQGILISSQQISADFTVVASKEYVATSIAGKADKATTLAGYGITDALTFEEITG